MNIIMYLQSKNRFMTTVKIKYHTNFYQKKLKTKNIIDLKYK